MAAGRPKRQLVEEPDCAEEPFAKKMKLSDDMDEDDKRGNNLNSSKMSVSKLNGLRNRHGNEKPAELFRKDMISAMKLPDSEQLQAEEYVTIADPWRQEWERGVQVPVNADIIPVAKTRYVEENEKLNGPYGFKLPTGKLLHAAKDTEFQKSIHELHDTQSLAEEVCRYDLDELDMYWLHLLNSERELMGEPPIEEWFMEKIMEDIEIKCFENMKVMIQTVEGLGIEYDENVVCDVCRCPDSEDTNEMVFCDKCDICVHQACYGLLSIPEGSWLCRICALGIRPPCVLCPKTGGAMKSTKSGSKWAHVACALWIPEVSIGCPEKMEPINKISNIPMSRWSLICSVCRERSGACIQCSVKTCKTSFHVTCAFQNGFKMDTILDENAEEEVQLKAYCAKHSKKNSGDALSPPVSPRKESELTEQEKVELRSHRLKKAAEEFYLCVEPKDLAERMKLDELTAELMYNYWVMKRKSNFNKPMITPKSDEADVLSKQQEDSLIARMKMFVHLRQDLERVRNLCYMLTKREKMKKQVYKMKEEIFYRQLHALKIDHPRMGSREAESVMSAHRLHQCNSREPALLSGVFYDDQDFIMHHAYLQDEYTPKGPFDHDIEHVKIRPLYRHRVPKDKSSQGESLDDKVKSLDARHAEKVKESIQFRERHQRESVVAKYSARRGKDLHPLKREHKCVVKRRDGRLSLPTKMASRSIKDNLDENVKGESVTRRRTRTDGLGKEEAENIETIDRQPSLPSTLVTKAIDEQVDTRLKENVQRHQLRNFVRKLVSPYKSDRPNRTKQINGLLPTSNLIVSQVIKEKVQNKLRRSSRHHSIPNGFHENSELVKLHGGPIGDNEMNILMHTPPERNAAKKAMAQMSPVRDRDKGKDKLQLFSGEREKTTDQLPELSKIVIKNEGQYRTVERQSVRRRLDSDQGSISSSKCDAGGCRSSRDTSPEVDVVSTRRRSRRSILRRSLVDIKARKTSGYDASSDDQSSIIDVDSDSDLVLSDNTSDKSETSRTVTRRRRSEIPASAPLETNKRSTRSSGVSDHWLKFVDTDS